VWEALSGLEKLIARLLASRVGSMGRKEGISVLTKGLFQDRPCPGVEF
jgi:hypothetical protein